MDALKTDSSSQVGYGGVIPVRKAPVQRQRMLRITRSGKKRWKELPDLGDLILAVAFDGADPADLVIARRVLLAATQRLNEHASGGNQA
jgi:MarR family transcriptional regulator, lower aerobic nicotinate degradation pathway regulator